MTNFDNIIFKVLICFVFFECTLNLAASLSPKRHHGQRKGKGFRRRSLTNNKSVSSGRYHFDSNLNSHLDPVNNIQKDGSKTISDTIQLNSLSSSQVHQVTSTKNSKGKYLDSQVFKTLLEELLAKLEAYAVAQNETSVVSSSSSIGGETRRQINSLNVRHCNLHGLWLSSIAGAAIELLPEQQHGHIDINTKIYELPDNPYPPLINSQWTGKGMISQESPTTLTLIFQEHIDSERDHHNVKEARGRGNHSGGRHKRFIHLPRTAVFVGQCLVCQETPMLQGTWIVFPAEQTCGGNKMSPFIKNFGSQEPVQMSDSNTPDMMYLLEKH